MKGYIVFITYVLTTHTTYILVKGQQPSTIRKFFLFVGLIAFPIFLCNCGEILDGPFNKNNEMVPPLLFADNGTNLVTFWDEDLKKYKTYDQEDKTFLGQAVFYLDESDKDGSRNYIIAGNAVVPMTQLNADGMQTQRAKGCSECHIL
jgi:hypothetical protein